MLYLSKNTARAKASAIYTLIVALFLLRCSGPVTPEQKEGYLPPTTPENVILNLQVSYTNKDIDGYLECLSEDFRFYYSGVGSWDKTEEERIHRNMFSGTNGATEINLKLSGGWNLEGSSDSEWTLLRAYELKHTPNSGEVEIACGQVKFHLRQEEGGIWRIEKWVELDF